MIPPNMFRTKCRVLARTWMELTMIFEKGYKKSPFLSKRRTINNNRGTTLIPEKSGTYPHPTMQLTCNVA